VASAAACQGRGRIFHEKTAALPCTENGGFRERKIELLI